MTRAEKIVKGKWWIVYLDATPDDIMFEGSKTACSKYLSENNLNRKYKKGIVRIGQLIWEKDL